jgi:hypothetical protein
MPAALRYVAVVRVWGPVVLVGVVAGCLSGGPPPTGQRLTSGRENVQLKFLGSKPGAPLLVWKNVDNFVSGSELHLLTPSTTDQPVSDRLLAQGVTYDSIFRDLVLDSRGRIAITLMNSNDPTIMYVPGGADLVLVDTATGAQQDLGLFNGNYEQSESGDRIIYDSTDGVHVHEIDDQDTLLGPLSAHVIPSLVGEDVYYLVGVDYSVPGGNVDADLWRFTRGGTPEHLTDHVSQLTVMSGLLVIMRGGMTQASASVTSILDPVTLHETPVPASSVVSISPDGRWLVATTQMDVPPLTVLFQPATGQTQTLQVPNPYFGVAWRPGQDGEAWLSFSGGGSTSTTLIARPGSTLVDISRQILSSYGPPVGIASPFSDDGKYFLALQSEFGYLDVRSPVSLVPVDDPMATGLLLNPTGSTYSFAIGLSDGGLLVGAWFKDSDRSDFYRYDLATGTSRLLGEAGSVVAVGQRRMLVLLHVVNQTGDLALVDLETGATTVLAQTVGAVTVEGPSGSDALAPGTRVAFSLINPIASPYDGVWIVTLP